MTAERWIVIPRWDEFQHRDMARSTVPPWVKNYTRLLHDDAYLDLTGHQRAVLHGLWLAYASARRHLVLNTTSLSAHLRLRVMTRDIEALNHAGFITFSASRPASNPASLEVEVEREKVLKPSRTRAQPKTPGSSFATRVASDPAGREHRPYDQPRDPAATIRKQIANGAIPDLETLESELDALHVNGATAVELRALIPAQPPTDLESVPGDPDADIPFD